MEHGSQHEHLGLAGLGAAPWSGLFVLSVISNLLLLTGPLFMLQVYDRVLASKSVPTLVALTGLMVVLYGFYAFLELLRTRMAIRFSTLVAVRHMPRLFASVVGSRARPGQARDGDPVRDLDSVRAFLSGQGPLAILDLPWMPLYLVVVFMFHPLLGWLAVAGAVAVTLLMIANEALSRRPSQSVDAAMSRRQNQLADAHGNAESIMSMGMRPTLTARWSKAAEALLMAQGRAADRATFFSAATKSFRLLLQSGVLALGAYLAIEGDITAGLMIAASIVTARALSPVEQAVANWRGFVSARQAMGRINNLAKLDRPTPHTALPLPKASLQVSELAVGPGRDGPPLVHGVTFALSAGEALGVLGVSGCGKSSLIRTLIGLWPPLAGTVRLDGSELGHFDQDRLGHAIGYLPQLVELFDGTVADNISRFEPEATLEAILGAAHAAGIHDLVAGLPQGYDTQIGERGAMLSAGQRQRIGLARALYGDPFLLVLDEPNSNLDSAGDTALNAAVETAKARGAIVIVVAHRPAAIASVDKLLYLTDGRMAMFGPRDEVLTAITVQPASLAAARKARGR